MEAPDLSIGPTDVTQGFLKAKQWKEKQMRGKSRRIHSSCLQENVTLIYNVSSFYLTEQRQNQHGSSKKVDAKIKEENISLKFQETSLFLEKLY